MKFESNSTVLTIEMDSLNNLGDQSRRSPIDDLAETKVDEADSAVSNQLSKRALKKLKKRQE